MLRIKKIDGNLFLLLPTEFGQRFIERVWKSSSSSELKYMLDHLNANFVLFRSYQKRVNYEVNINILNYSANSLVSLERKEYIKYVGVLIDSKWSQTRISLISSKISKSLSILSRLRNFVPQTVLLNLHRSFIQA